MHSPEADVLMETLRKARLAAGLSQREVGKRLGFHSTIYGKIERGDRVLDVVELVAFANAVGANPLSVFADYLLALQQARLNGPREESHNSLDT